MPALKTTAARARGPSAGAPCGRVNDNARATAGSPEDGVQCKTGPSGPLKLTRVLLVCREARPPVTEHGGPPGGGTWSGASASFPSAASQPGSDASVARRRLALVEGASGAGRRAPLSNQSTPRRAAATGRPSRLALTRQRGDALPACAHYITGPERRHPPSCLEKRVGQAFSPIPRPPNWRRLHGLVPDPTSAAPHSTAVALPRPADLPAEQRRGNKSVRHARMCTEASGGGTLLLRSARSSDTHVRPCVLQGRA